MKMVQAVHSVCLEHVLGWILLHLLKHNYLACFSKMSRSKPTHMWCGTRTLEMSKERSKWQCCHIMATSMVSMKTVVKVSFFGLSICIGENTWMASLRPALEPNCKDNSVAHSWYCSKFTRNQIGLIAFLLTYRQYSVQNFASNSEYQYATLIATL